MSEFVLGLDLGTTNLKALLVTRQGMVAGLGSRRLCPVHPAEGWCEIAPERFLAVLGETITDALAQAGAQAGDIRGVSYASQANTFVLLDAEHRPLTPFIIWNDQRAGSCDEGTQAFTSSDEFLCHMGFRLPPTELAVAKLRWIAREQPSVWSRARRFASLSDYLVWVLTGSWKGDQGTASLLGLWSQIDEQWWGKALDFIGRDEGFFPTMQRPGTLVGVVSESGSRALGIGSGAVVAVGSLDHHVAAWGAGIGDVAPCADSTGTVVACLRLCEERCPKPKAFLGPDVESGRWYAAAFSPNGASRLEQCRDAHSPSLDIQQLVRLAAEAPAGTCLARFARDANSIIFEGDTSHPGSRARAVMVAVAGELETLVDQLYQGGRPTAIVATGGGANSDLWLSIKSSLLGVPFHRTNTINPAPFGAALFAAKAVGWFPSVADASAGWIRVAESFAPEVR